MTPSFRLGRLFGIPIHIHYTWFVIFFLVTFSLSYQYFPYSYPRWASWLHWTVGVTTSLLFFASVLAHELTHSLVSAYYGIPVRSITLFIFGGVASITREARRPWPELAMASSGPLSSLAIGGLFWLLWWFTAPVSEPVAALARWLLRINIILALFNLIPGFPLDGGRVFRSIVWQITGNYRLATNLAYGAGQALAYLFILGGIIIAIFFGELFTGLWFTVIGWFLSTAVGAGKRYIRYRDGLAGLRVGEIMSREWTSVSPVLTLQQLVEGYVWPTGQHIFLVESEGKLQGMITLSNIRAVPRSRWALTSVAQIMTGLSQLRLISPQAEATELLELMDEEAANAVPVAEAGRVVGLITREALLRLLHVRAQLRH